MSTPSSHRRSKLLSLGGLRRPSTSLQPLAGPNSPISPSSHRTSQFASGRRSYDDRSPSPNYSDPFTSAHGHERDMDDLPLPSRPYTDRPNSGLSSRRSSVDSGKDGKERPASLSINYVPSKFTKLHAPGDYAHRRAKTGGGRDAFGRDAQRMGMMGTVDDDEGVVFQLGKGGLKKKKPKLRWNRFKWVLFVANTVLIAYGIAFLIASILVWLNVFYQSDVIRVANRTELILSTTAAALITLTALIGYSGIVLNNRAFLAVYTFLLWACLALMVAPGYIAYKKKAFNLEGKINYQWSRDLHTEGRLRVQNALRCCGYFSPFVEATQSPLCYARSNLPGCKNRYLKLERHVLTTWFTIAFSLVPAHILIMISALLCSNHITYRFGKGLTPKRYRLDLGSMAVIMDEYASQIAAQYGPQLANEAFNRSSTNLDANVRHSLSVPASRSGSSSNLAAMGMATGTSGGLTRPTSRFNPSYAGNNNGAASSSTAHSGKVSMYDPSTDGLDGSRGGTSRTTAGSAGESRYNDTETDAGVSSRYGDSEEEYAQYGHGQPGQYGGSQGYGQQASQYDQHAHGWAR